MKIVIASNSPVKEKAVKRAFKALFPEASCTFALVPANSGIRDQPMSNDEIRSGALGRVIHARELSPDADFYVGLEGGVEEIYGELYNYGWVVVESKDHTKGWSRTMTSALPTAIRKLILHEGMEQAHATDIVFSKSGTKTATGTIGPLTKEAVTYADWYTQAVIGALVKFAHADLYTEPLAE